MGHSLPTPKTSGGGGMRGPDSSRLPSHSSLIYPTFNMILHKSGFLRQVLSLIHSWPFPLPPGRCCTNICCAESLAQQSRRSRVSEPGLEASRCQIYSETVLHMPSLCSNNKSNSWVWQSRSFVGPLPSSIALLQYKVGSVSAYRQQYTLPQMQHCISTSLPLLSPFSLLEMAGSFLLCFSESLSSIQALLPTSKALMGC